MKIKTYNILIVIASILVTLTSSFIIFTLIPINKNNTNINNNDNINSNNENTNTNNKEDDEENNNNIKELFIYFETEYNRFEIQDYSSNSTEDKFIDYYKCINNKCNYVINKNIVVIYDKDKVIYKDLNKKDSFKESKSEKTITFYDSINESNVTIEVYNILTDDYYIINLLYNDGYKNIKYLYKPNRYVRGVEDGYDIIAFDKNTLEDGYVAIYGISIYDFKNKHIVFSDPYNVIDRGLDFNKVNDFYILSGAEDVMYDYIYTSNFELVTNQVYIFNDYDYYIKDNIIFYIDYIDDNKQLIVKDKNNKQIEYPSKNINPIRIRDSYLLYLDNDNTIKIKDLSNNKVVVDSNLKINKDDFRDFYIKSDNFYIEYVDSSLKTTDKWKECVKKYLNENEISSLDGLDEPGYLLEFNKKNELIRKEVKVLEYYDW